MEAVSLTKNDLGTLGEEKAAEYLEAEGYEIIGRNFSCKIGEIDIIAHPRGENIICFAEVKTRRNRDYGRPAEAVTPTKQRHIRRVATYYLLKMWDHLGADARTDFRFDVIEVDFTDDKPEVNLIASAFA
jgi:putative endonuclease